MPPPSMAHAGGFLVVWLCAASQRVEAGGSAADAVPLVQRTLQPEHPVTEASATVDKDSDLFRLLGRVLHEKFAATKQLKTQHRPQSKDLQAPQREIGSQRATGNPPRMGKVEFGIKAAERGSTADIVMPGSVCTKRGSVTTCTFDPKGDVNPHVQFVMRKPMDDRARFHATTSVLLMGEELAYFAMDCKLCGQPCQFQTFKSVASWELPACPVPTEWTLGLDLLGMHAPPGAEVRIDVQDLRKGKPGIAYYILTQF
eukprot:CAMPEP_0171110118 /NCGR_PEP_ID=MMETSP0766_2-20121228/71173_1 /TAXON_ID=439317 /ORGANISM="Gambierdiscus australes, Strain CAWD 149" /LENGTH=256 /DNA_ID=CAMNT_0011571955 /DNA_START=26 /DNA_END=796 /DNA_ORIENTATION=+